MSHHQCATDNARILLYSLQPNNPRKGARAVTIKVELGFVRGRVIRFRDGDDEELAVQEGRVTFLCLEAEWCKAPT